MHSNIDIINEKIATFDEKYHRLLMVKDYNVTVTTTPHDENKDVVLMTLKHVPSGIIMSGYGKKGEELRLKLMNDLRKRVIYIGPPARKKVLGPSYAFNY